MFQALIELSKGFPHTRSSPAKSNNYFCLSDRVANYVPINLEKQYANLLKAFPFMSEVVDESFS